MEKIYKINSKEDHNKSLVWQLVSIEDKNLDKVKEKYEVIEVKQPKQKKSDS